VNKPNPDLLEQIAEAFEQTSDFIDHSGTELRMVNSVPPQAATAMLKFQAAAMRRLAKRTRDGRPVVGRERCSTDG
jgi:hypothetical protein